MKEKIFIILTFDIDNDPVINTHLPGSPDSPLDWKGTEAGIPAIKTKISDCASREGLDMKTTWYVRCDNQLKEIYGDAGYLLDKYRAIWTSLKNDKAEIAWHAHLYKRDRMLWIQETDDATLAINLKRGYETMVKKQFHPVSARIGESYMSDGIMSTLDDLDIRTESTAMPGRVRKDEKFSIDWQHTPGYPYHPSKENYRIPGSNPHAILEVPMSMIPTQVSYDKQPLARYVNLGFHPSVIKTGLSDYIRQNRLLVSITHPFEITPSITSPYQKHPLLSFSAEAFADNLNHIITESKRAKKECIFIRSKDILDESVYEYIMQEQP